MGDSNHRNLSINGLAVDLEIDRVCDRTFPLIAPMALHVLEVGGDSSSSDRKNIDN